MKKPLPTIYLNSDQLPEIKDWKVGGKYSLCLEVEQSSMRQGSEYDMEMIGGEKVSKDLITATFKVTKVEVDKEDAEEMTYAEEYAKKRSGAKANS